jgi:hypothetical protein
MGTKSCILFLFDSDLPGGLRPATRFELGRTVCVQAFTPTVVLFIALPETEKTDLA